MSGSNNVIDNLILQIYETANNPEQWPDLFDALFLFLDQNKDLVKESADQKQLISSQTWISALNSFSGSKVNIDDNNDRDINILKHFQQALTIIHTINKHETLKETIENILQRLPIGIILFSSDMEIISHNQISQNLFPNLHSFNSLDFLIEKDKNWVIERIRDLKKPINAQESYSTLLESNPEENVAAFIFATNAVNRNYFALLLSNIKDLSSIDPAFLSKTYKLTPTEIDISKLLAQGLNIKNISDEKYKSEATIRTHVKNILRKTGAQKQSELIRILSSSPLISYNTELPQLINLPDGRHISYKIDGSHNSKTLVFFHSAVGSRFELPDQLIKNLNKEGYKIISFDRADYSYSDELEDKSFQTCNEDTKYILDQLNIESAVLVGYAMGGVIACHFAEKYPEYCQGLILIGSGDKPNKKEIDEHYYIYKLTLRMLTTLPKIYFNLASIMKRGIQKNPERFYQDHIKPITKKESALLETNWFKNHLLKNFKEVIRSSSKSLAPPKEAYLYCNKWGCDPKNIKVPTLLLHGEKDVHTPISLGKKLASKIPNSRIEPVPGVGVFMIYCEQDFLLQQVVEFYEETKLVEA